MKDLIKEWKNGKLKTWKIKRQLVNLKLITICVSNGFNYYITIHYQYYTVANCNNMQYQTTGERDLQRMQQTAKLYIILINHLYLILLQHETTTQTSQKYFD